MLEPYLWRFCLLGRQIATAVWVSWFWSVFQLTTQKIVLIVYKPCDNHHTLFGFYLGQISQSLTWFVNDIMTFIAASENSKKLFWVYSFPASIFLSFTSEVESVNRLSNCFQESSLWQQDFDVFEMLLNSFTFLNKERITNRYLVFMMQRWFMYRHSEFLLHSPETDCHTYGSSG